MPPRPLSSTSWNPAAFVSAAVLLTCAIGDGRAQDAGEPKYATWSKLEAADATREFKERLKEAGSLDQAARTFLLQEALPQLANEENRSSIERVRRRMREVLLTEIGNPQVLAAANGVVAEFMEALARDGAADPVARVNAAVMIGELRNQDGKPWLDAVPRLAGLAKDPRSMPAVRIAAVSGLSRLGPAVAATPETTAAVGQAVLGILTEPAVASRPEQDWLAGRALGLLPSLVQEYPKPVADQIANILTDESRSIDVRVRAAAALGARAGAKSAVDTGQAVAAIESLAIRALSAHVETAERKRAEENYRHFVGGKPVEHVHAAGGKGAATMIPEQVARREAWRLITLAGALDGGDGATGGPRAGAGGKGLAGVAEPAVAEKATALAATLRKAALALDAEPTDQSVAAALELLRPTAKKPKPKRQDGDQPAGEKPDPDRQAPPGDDGPQQPSPFESSPFG